MGGCIHDIIAEHMPDLAPFLKWHLTSTDGPMHYKENALFWAGYTDWNAPGHANPPNWKHLRSTIVYGAAPGDITTQPEALSKTALVGWLDRRLPRLLDAFRADVESLGLTY